MLSGLTISNSTEQFGGANGELAAMQYTIQGAQLRRPRPSYRTIALNAGYAVKIGVVAGEMAQTLTLHYRDNECVASQ